MTTLNWKLLAGIAGAVLFVLFAAWFFFFRPTSELEPADTAQQETLGEREVRVSTGVSTQAEEETNVAEQIPSPVSKQKVFKISDGPVAGAAFMQELRPTTTIARFVMQQNGHILDLGLDIPGTVARASSNTTIPGVARVVWGLQAVAARQVASTAMLQYMDAATLKTVLLNFPAASTTASSTARAPVRIQFLPNDILALATSPDGRSIVYVLAAPGGADGYVARQDGSNARKAFSLPLSHIELSWPSAGALLVSSKSAVGVAGIAFSVDVASGAASPILYSPGLTAVADATFAHVVYQSATEAGRSAYAHNTSSNLDHPLSFDPMPQKCAWSRSQASLLYCAVPLARVPVDYLDLWHQGRGGAADSLISYNLLTGKTTILATPGGADGGVESDIAELSASPDDKYLMFIKRGDRTLWGVRLY